MENPGLTKNTASIMEEHDPYITCENSTPILKGELMKTTQDSYKLLTIGMPIYNEEDSLEANLGNLTSIINDNNLSADVSIFCSNNCSTDATAAICENFSLIHPNIFSYVTNSKNLGYDRNVDNVVRLSNSKYVWLLSGNDSIVPAALLKVINFLRNYELSYIFVRYFNKDIEIGVGDLFYTDKDNFINAVKWGCTLMSSNIIRKDLWESWNMGKYFDSNWEHMGYIIELLNHYTPPPPHTNSCYKRYLSSNRYSK